MTVPAGVLPDIVEEHLDEATFLFEQWAIVARSPRFSLIDLQRSTEPRLAAHLDGLAVGGPEVANSFLWPALGDDAESPARVTAAALALLQESNAATRDRLVEILRTTVCAPVREGLACAFKVSRRDDLAEPSRLAVYAPEDPASQAALLRVLAAKRIDPGPILNALLQRGEPDLLGAALAAASTADRTRLRQAVEARLSHDAPEVRAAALRTALIWNLQPGWQACTAEARAGTADAMLLLAMLGGPRDLPTLVDALRSGKHRQAALFALGFSGQVDAVEACLPLLDDPDEPTVKLAFEAIAGITGLPMYDDAFTAPAKEKSAAAADADAGLPPLEEDLATDLTPLAHDAVPLPNAAQVRKWWSARRASMATSQRYVRGMVLTTASVQLALGEGSLRRTGPLALEVAIRSGGRTQLPALRLGQVAPTLPPEIGMHRTPGWS
jgi:uncharacterized protein (TIGR02270 family)